MLDIAITRALIYVSVAAAVGAFTGIAAIYSIVLRKRDRYFQVTDDRIAEELIEIKSNQKVFFALAPVVAVVLAVVGVKGWEGASELVDQEYRDATRKFERREKQLAERLKEADALVQVLKKNTAEMLRIGELYAPKAALEELASKNQVNQELQGLRSYINTGVETLDRKFSTTLTVADFNRQMLDYWRKKELDAVLDSKADKSLLENEIGKYLEIRKFNERLGEYVTAADLKTRLAAKVDTARLDSELPKYLVVKTFNDRISAYPTEEAMKSRLAGKVDRSRLDTLLPRYLTVEGFNGKIRDYMTTDDLTNRLGAKADKSELADFRTDKDHQAFLRQYDFTKLRKP